jgi:hypothetical protein
MSDTDFWPPLLTRIDSHRCTPFLGAGASSGTLPLGSDVAERWAREEDYPLDDVRDLGRVAQFVSVKHGDPMWPKERLCEELCDVGPPDFDRPDEPHAVLAELPLPIYVSTNYDDFMVQALRRAGREPHREICRWNDLVRGEPSVFDTEAFVPTVQAPVVYHLHGTFDLPESLVLTEDDYLDFLVSVSRRPDLLPPRIQSALANASLLFLGYRLADADFRVLHRGLVATSNPGLRRLSIAVQLPPQRGAQAHEEAQNYLDRYFGVMSVRVYWGDATTFAGELRERWRARADRAA